MGDFMEENKCDVLGCNNPSYRSISLQKIKKLGIENLQFNTNRRKVRLCKEHYKVVKKYLKKERKFEKWRWGY